MQKEIGAMQRLRYSDVENVTKKVPDDYVIATEAIFGKKFINLSLKALNIKYMMERNKIKMF